MSYFNKVELKSVANLDLLARQVVEGFIIGLHKSPYHGFSVEFAEHRHYNPGESTKNIDWKVYGRTDKLYTKKYEEETNLRCQIVIDTSSSMFYPQYDISDDTSINKFQFSSLAAAALMNLLKRQRDAFGLSLFNEEVLQHVRPKSSTTQYKLLLSYLDQYIADIPQKKTTSAASALHEIADRIHKRSMVIVFSDLHDSNEKMDELFSAMQHLKFNKHEVVFFHVMDKKSELDFEFENRPYEFIDLESDRRIKLQPNQVKEQYQVLVHDYIEAIKVKCLQFRIDYNFANISDGFHPILRSFLMKRSKMST
jgi:uncharacterized protein (DUF58 family)